MKRTDAAHWFYWPDPVDGPWRLTILWGLVDGRFDCIGMEIRRAPGLPFVPVTTSVLRSLSLTGVVADKRRTFREVLPFRAPEGRQFFSPPRGSGGRPRLTDEHLAEVARVYSDSWARGEPPTLAVKEAFGPMSYSTAAKWVMEARRRGFLDPTPKGKAGGVPLPPDRPENKGNRRAGAASG